MNYSIDLIKSKAENVLNEQISSVIPFMNITNNFVFKIITRKQQYIFKIYKQGWPEDGKLLFVNKILIQNNIPCAKIIFYCHTDRDLINGFLIEEFLPGVIADKAIINIKQENELFKKMAEFVGRIHSIEFSKYGYIGSGKPYENTYTDYILDAFDDNTTNLRNNELFNESELQEIKDKLYDSLHACDTLSPILCHGDLSKKNVLIQNNGEIILIDYDDVTAIPWVCDVARLTYWMKLNYPLETALKYKNIFLENYPSTENDIFYATENALHVWESLGYMNFSYNTPMYTKVKPFFLDAWKKLKEKRG